MPAAAAARTNESRAVWAWALGLLIGAALLAAANPAGAREGGRGPGYLGLPEAGYVAPLELEALLRPRNRIAAQRPLPADAMGFHRRTAADPKEEIACLALNVYFEARNEPELGQRAVAHVVMNRVADRAYPKTICEVVRQGGEARRPGCQFSWWCDGQSDEPTSARHWQRSSAIALEVYWGRSADPTEGALWYHADYVSPYWRHKLQRGPKIGRHIFYSNKPLLEVRRPDKAKTQLASRYFKR